MMKLLILALITAYCVFVIAKKIKNFKNGKYCSCGCDNCTAKCGKKR